MDGILNCTRDLSTERSLHKPQMSEDMLMPLGSHVSLLGEGKKNCTQKNKIRVKTQILKGAPIEFYKGPLPLRSSCTFSSFKCMALRCDQTPLNVMGNLGLTVEAF